MNPVYDSRHIPAHDDKVGASVFLMNEAPGPSEAISGIPSFGVQGANIFHALRRAGIQWALASPLCKWPKNGAATESKRHQQKDEFLKNRARYITCTNAFSYWPKPSSDSTSFCPPLDADVNAVENIARIRNEINPKHRVILVCGAHAYLACLGRKLLRPSDQEGVELNSAEIEGLNERLQSNFEKGWYMGHTRRWSMNIEKISPVLSQLAQFVGWSLNIVDVT